MPREDVIALVGTVVEALEDGLYRVELSNGHRLLAYPTRKSRPWAVGLPVGQRLVLEISPFDFSKGRIVSEEPKLNS